MKLFLSAFKFIFLRSSAFLFDMIALSFISVVLVTVIFDLLKIDIKFFDVIFSLSKQDSLFESLIYILMICFYYFAHIITRRSTLGIWIISHDYFEKAPSIDEESDEDKENEEVKKVAAEDISSMTLFWQRLYKVTIYLIFQALNIALMGFLTIYAAFTHNKTPLQEKASGIYIMKK